MTTVITAIEIREEDAAEFAAIEAMLRALAIRSIGEQWGFVKTQDIQIKIGDAVLLHPN